MVSTRGWGHCQTQKVPALPSLWLSVEFGHFSHEPPLTTRETPPPLTMLSLHRLLAHLSHLVTPSTQTSSLSSSQVLIHGLVTCLGHSPKSTGWWQTDGPGPMLGVSCGLCRVRSAVGCAGLEKVWDVLVSPFFLLVLQEKVRQKLHLSPLGAPGIPHLAKGSHGQPWRALGPGRVPPTPEVSCAPSPARDQLSCWKQLDFGRLLQG